MTSSSGRQAGLHTKGRFKAESLDYFKHQRSSPRSLDKKMDLAYNIGVRFFPGLIVVLILTITQYFKTKFGALFFGCFDAPNVSPEE